MARNTAVRFIFATAFFSVILLAHSKHADSWSVVSAGDSDEFGRTSHKNPCPQSADNCHPHEVRGDYICAHLFSNACNKPFWGWVRHTGTSQNYVEYYSDNGHVKGMATLLSSSGKNSQQDPAMFPVTAPTPATAGGSGELRLVRATGMPINLDRAGGGKNPPDVVDAPGRKPDAVPGTPEVRNAADPVQHLRDLRTAQHNAAAKPVTRDQLIGDAQVVQYEKDHRTLERFDANGRSVYVAKFDALGNPYDLRDPTPRTMYVANWTPKGTAYVPIGTATPVHNSKPGHENEIGYIVDDQAHVKIPEGDGLPPLDSPKPPEKTATAAAPVPEEKYAAGTAGEFLQNHKAGTLTDSAGNKIQVVMDGDKQFAVGDLKAHATQPLSAVAPVASQAGDTYTVGLDKGAEVKTTAEWRPPTPGAAPTSVAPTTTTPPPAIPIATGQSDAEVSRGAVNGFPSFYRLPDADSRLGLATGQFTEIKIEGSINPSYSNPKDVGFSTGGSAWIPVDSKPGQLVPVYQRAFEDAGGKPSTHYVAVIASWVKVSADGKSAESVPDPTVAPAIQPSAPPTQVALAPTPSPDPTAIPITAPTLPASDQPPPPPNGVPPSPTPAPASEAAPSPEPVTPVFLGP